ncbi:MAG: biotin--[Clostridia bacterium]|nr:biotin--[acetyl-CoA-carboxylase] ligase [Clostridia bacterium]
MNLSLNTIKLKSVDSTNNYAKALLKSGEPLMPYTVIYTKEQTKGRGRLGRSWHSKEEESLCMSLIIPNIRSSGITLLCALGVHRALRRLCPQKLQIKWPNDIICENKKLCGILTEGVKGFAVAGIGINLNSTDFPADIAHKATSLRVLTGKLFDGEELCREIATSVFETIEEYGGMLTEDAIREYTPLCANMGREVTAENAKGIATGIDPDGSLKIATEKGIANISFGEVIVTDIY